MENGPFIDGLPINSMVIFYRYVSHYQRVNPMVNPGCQQLPWLGMVEIHPFQNADDLGMVGLTGLPH